MQYKICFLHVFLTLQCFDFSAGRQQLEDLLDVDFDAVVGETGVAEHHTERIAGGKLFDEVFGDAAILVETGSQSVAVDKQHG